MNNGESISDEKMARLFHANLEKTAEQLINRNEHAPTPVPKDVAKQRKMMMQRIQFGGSVANNNNSEKSTPQSSAQQIISNAVMDDAAEA